MPSLEHELLVELLRTHPRLVLELLRSAFGRTTHGLVEVAPVSENLTELQPPERRADLVLVVRPSTDAAPTAAIVVEVQLRPDPRKRFAWPVYIAVLRARLACPVTLVVLALDETTARWAGVPIDLDDAGSAIWPTVIGPTLVPVVDDACARRQPELALLSLLAHRGEPVELPLARTLVRALDGIDDARAAWYADVVLSFVDHAVRAALEAEMIPESREFRSEFMRRIVAESEARGVAFGEAHGAIEALRQAISKVLEARGLALGGEHRARVVACDDRDRLEAWLVLAVSVAHAGELFEH